MDHSRRGYTLAEWLLIIVLVGMILAGLRWYVGVLGGPMDLTMSLAVSPDGQSVVTGQYDGRLQIWRAGGQGWAELGRHSASISQVVFSSDGKMLASSAVDGSVRICDLRTGKSRNLLPGRPRGYVSVAFAPDSKSIAIAPSVGPFQIHDTATGQITGLINQGGGRGIISVGFAHGGKTLVALSGAGSLELYDPVNGQLIAGIPLAGKPPRSMAISPDGHTVAVPTLRLAGVKFSVEIWDMDKRRMRTQLTGFKQPAWALSFSPDGRTLVTAADDLKVWDAVGGNLRTTMSETRPVLLAAFSSQRAVLFTGTLDGAVDQRDPASLRPIGAIRGTRESSTGIPYYLAGFVVWLIVWKVVRGRRKRVCSECGRKFIVSDRRPVVLCRTCYQRSLSPDPAAAGLSRGLRRAALLVAVVVFLFLWDTFLLRRGPAGIMWGLGSLALLVLAAGLLFVLLVLLLVLRMRWTMKRLSQEQNSLRLARKVSNSEGVLERFEPITLWSSGNESAAPTVRLCIERCKRRLESLVGERVEPREPLRILAFEKREQFTGYCRGLLVNPGNLDGFYQNVRQRTIVFSLGADRTRVPHPERVLRTTLAFYFLESKKGFFLPFWLNQGIGHAAGEDESPPMQGRLNRRMLAALEGGKAFGVKELFQLKGRALFRMIQSDSSHARFVRFVQWSSQALSVVEYLAGAEAPADRRTRFHAFVTHLERKDKHAELFEHHFGFTYEQLLHDWQSWVRRQGTGQQEAPPDLVHQALCERIIPLAGDPLSRISDRVAAIREMGRNGYALGADTLIQILRQREELLRLDAIWALEAISGRALGDDVPAWDAWWASLPLEIRMDHVAPEMAEPDPSGTRLPA